MVERQERHFDLNVHIPATVPHPSLPSHAASAVPASEPPVRASKKRRIDGSFKSSSSSASESAPVPLERDLFGVTAVSCKEKRRRSNNVKGREDEEENEGRAALCACIQETKD